MPNVATPTEVRQLGIALEVTRGTAPAAPTKFLSVTKDSNIDYTTKLLEDPALRGYNSRFASFAGAQEGKGPLKAPVRASEISQMLKMLLGSPTTSVEQASFVIVTGTNDTIDFNIGAGNLVATIPAGTYIMGQTQADALSLCKAVKDAITAAEAVGVYTVAYSRVTGFMTITRSAGTFQMKFLTGPNTAKTIAATLGYAVADQTGALFYTSTVALTTPFKHTFVQGNNVQLPSYSFYLNRGLAANPTKVYNLGSMSKLKFSGKDDAPVDIEASIMAQQEAIYAGAWTPVYSESPVLMFNQTTVKLAGSAPTVPNIVEWSVDMEPGLKPYRPLAQTLYPQDFLAAGPFMAQGDLTVYFMDEVERAKFIAASVTSLEFSIVGSNVAGGTVKNTLDLLYPVVEYEAFPLGDQGGFLGAKVKWRARGSIAAGVYVPVVTAYVINGVVPGF